MSHLRAKLFLVAALVPLSCFGQSPIVTAQTPPQSQPQSAPLPPSSRDMPMPDPATFPRHDDKTKPLVDRMVDRLSPLCVDAIFHTCLPWGTSDVSQTSEANREFTKNFEIGDVYFKSKNYRGAESRFREALEYRPDDPEATYKLAVSVDKLGRRDEAHELYEDYLKLSPRGPDADRVRNALVKMKKSESSLKRDTK
jgi:tetratricopeptide (TPR) repeat protein